MFSFDFHCDCRLGTNAVQIESDTEVEIELGGSIASTSWNASTSTQQAGSEHFDETALSDDAAAVSEEYDYDSEKEDNATTQIVSHSGGNGN